MCIVLDGRPLKKQPVFNNKGGHLGASTMLAAEVLPSSKIFFDNAVRYWESGTQTILSKLIILILQSSGNASPSSAVEMY